MLMIPFQRAVIPSSLAIPQPVEIMPRYLPTCIPLSPYKKYHSKISNLPVK
jgi:hypothetical protein